MMVKFQDLPWTEWEDVFLLLEKLFPAPQKVALGISWGSDSMYLAFLMVSFWGKKNRPKDQLFFLHCNHQVRKESSDEQKFLSDFFQDWNFGVFIREKNWSPTENELRKRRYACFQKFCQENQISTLVLWHHLNDRVETSMMNLIRGCGLKGLLNMHIQDHHPLLPSCIKLMRPLLWFTKKAIEENCLRLHIPFFQDETNTNPEVSLRNRIRNGILPLFEDLSFETAQGSSFLESRKTIYQELEKQDKSDPLKRLIPIKKNPYRNAEEAFQRMIPKNSRKDASVLVDLLQTLDITVRKGELQELENWIANGTGIHELDGRTIFLSHDQVFIIKAKPRFWEKELHLEKKITEGGVQSFGKFQLDIPKKLINATLRFPRPGDYFHWKLLKKRAINQKIPIFRRNSLPLAEKDGKIIVVFEPAHLIF